MAQKGSDAEEDAELAREGRVEDRARWLLVCRLSWPRTSSRDGSSAVDSLEGKWD